MMGMYTILPKSFGGERDTVIHLYRFATLVVLYLPEWNVYKNAHVRAIIANDAPTNHS